MKRPNIVLILADDMGYGDFGIFSEGRTRTSNLDRLCAEGLCLTQHYSGSAVCAPARAALMTGRYPHRTGAIDTLDSIGLDQLSLSETTLAEVLAGAGYATGLIGKWHLGAALPEYHPNSRGFQEFCGFRGGWSYYWDYALDYNRTFRRSDGTYMTDVFSQEACNFVNRHSQEPFFLHVTYNAPHFPMELPEANRLHFADGDWTDGVARVYGMIERMDWGIGQLLETLEAKGVLDNTIVMFTSDNGPQFGGQGEQCTTRWNCNWNGAKCLVFEGGIRVPAVVRWPDGVAGGQKYDGMAHFCDWFPTLLAATGTELPSDLALDGVNILPALQGQPQEGYPNRCWQWNRYTPAIESNAAIRDGDWKLVRPALPQTMTMLQEHIEQDPAVKRNQEGFAQLFPYREPERDLSNPPAPLLYNIAEDPLEAQDLAGAQPDKVHKLTTQLETWFEDVEADRRRITRGG